MATEDVAVLPWLTHQQQPAVYRLLAVYLCTVWLLSGSVSNLCLCSLPVTRASAISQQVQSASVCVNSDQDTEQSSRCKLSVEQQNANSCVFIY